MWKRTCDLKTAPYTLCGTVLTSYARHQNSRGNQRVKQSTPTGWKKETKLRSGRRHGASRRGADTTTAKTCTLLHERSDSNWQTCSPGLFIRLQLVSFAAWEGILGATGSWPALQPHSHMGKQAQQLFFSSLICSSIWRVQTGCDKTTFFITTFNTYINIIKLHTACTFSPSF